MSSKSLESNPESSTLEKALDSLQNRDFKLSVEYFEKLLSSNQQNPLVYHKAAELYYHLKEYSHSQELNCKAIQFYNQNPSLTDTVSSNDKPNDLIINILWLSLKLDELLSSSSKLFDTIEELKKAIDKYQIPRKDEINRDITRISQMYQSKSSYRVSSPS